MTKRKWSKSVLLFAVFTLTLMGFQQFAFCTGGGGGDGEERDQFSNLASFQGAATTKVSELSREELIALMSGLNADVRDSLLADFSNWPEGVTVKDLIHVIDSGVPVSALTEKDIEELFSGLDEKTREYLLTDFDLVYENKTVRDLKGDIQRWLEGNRVRANTWAYFVDKAATSVEIADWVGEKTQTVLGYCPGVGLATAVILDTTRAAADARKEGKNTSEIAEAAAVKGTFSFFFNYYSKADEILETAVQGATEKAGQLALYLGAKEAEAQAGSALEKSTSIKAKDIENMEIAATFVKDMVYGMPARKNKVTKPTYTSSTGYGPGQTHQTQHTAQ